MLAAIGIFLASLSLQDVLALMNWRDKQKTGDADEPSEPHPYPLPPIPYPLFPIPYPLPPLQPRIADLDIPLNPDFPIFQHPKFRSLNLYSLCSGCNHSVHQFRRINVPT